eukprot:Transcript_17212.p1 GENE.Transcript_17212~~Transcript_17212.p1  ORF type:complete len:818 (+),score=477.15 Transcript_17212:124-2577(+)
MRIMIKGGVWKNTEDEILKAAVMKYGKNQWSRISSLLVRKSAKQCKARWHEWLDPSIKKTEWSREEEEKLLHLAKLMPTQWRTIAPIVGRTAAQCLEHYERLLDQATRKDQDYKAEDDPRRLRPGEIDPNPEGKPARPDPIDMDEDEKEMLSEARARLANTRGKKAKRKAREKQLEEARRLAALQKRRELKAAGIDMAQRKRKVRGVDYNSEIPFQKTAPAGFYDTTGEDEQAEAAIRQDDGKFKSILKSKLEAPRKDLMEAKARKQDAEKRKRRQEENLPAAVAALNKQKDLLAIQKRQKLMLPPPQVTDRELSDVVKASQSAFADEGEVDATRLLTNSYEQTPSAEQMRTPRTATGASGGDLVLEEAAAQAAVLAQDSALKGGEAADLAPLGEFGGITPRALSGAAAPTPNPLATPGATPGRGGGGATPARSVAGGATPASSTAGGATPGRGSVAGSVASSVYGGRDAFGINAEEGDLMGLHPAAQRRQLKERRAALGAQLASLPAPAHEYSIVMPEMPAEGEGEEEGEAREEDALDREDREAAEAAAELAAEIAKRSSAVQRELPRPLVVNRELLAADAGGGGGGDAALAAADQMLREEMVKMLESDASQFPVKGAPEPTKKKKAYKQLEPELLQQAKELLAAEQDALAAAAPPPSADELRAAWEKAQAELIYVPSQQRYAPQGGVGKAERLQAYQQQLQLVKNFMTRDNKKAHKAEKKLEVTLGGYKKRASALQAEIVGHQVQAQEKRLELRCFEMLHQQEGLARPQRLSAMSALVSEQSAREAELQGRYAELLRTRDGLLEQLQQRQNGAGH